MEVKVGLIVHSCFKKHGLGFLEEFKACVGTDCHIAVAI